MKRKFWQFVHDRLEFAWHWVYRTKLGSSSTQQGDIGQNKFGAQTFQCGSGEMGTLYWSKGADLDKFPEMRPATAQQMQYFRKNPDGSYTNLGCNFALGQTDTYPYRCEVCFTSWDQDKPLVAERCPSCGSCRTVAQ